MASNESVPESTSGACPSTHPLPVAASEPVMQDMSSEQQECAGSEMPCCSMGDSGEQIPDNVYEYETLAQALAGNKDLLALKQTMATLRAQQAQTIRNLDRMREFQRLLHRDPVGFVKLLQQGKLHFPARQKLAQPPVIDWSQYTKHINFHPTSRREARLLQRLVHGEEEEEKAGEGGSDSEGDVRMVRGRVKDESKPPTFNKLWTAEEQAKLEALLNKYPSEPVESRRWKKIAAELKDRSPAQVASRVQKYFIKLAKNHLPIPGRPPSQSLTKKAGHRSRSYHPYVQHESTFLQSYQPVNLPDHDLDEPSTAIRCNTEDDPLAVSDEEDVPEYQRNHWAYKEILKLKQFKRMLQVRHVGYACDKCLCDPIVGTRWHCSDCPAATSVDFCENCMDSAFENETHNSSHRLKPLRTAEDSGTDSEYQAVARIDNYLDPNYIPYS